MASFHTIYKAVLDKLAYEQKESGAGRFNILEQYILNNPSLTKQYIVFKTIEEKRNLKEEDAKNFILFVEKYCSKLQYDKLHKANNKFAQYFNIDTSQLTEGNNLDTTVDNLLRFTTGGTALLFEGTKYRADLLKHLTSKKQQKENTTEQKFKTFSPKFVLEAVTEAVSQDFDKLNEDQQRFVNIVRNSDYDKLVDQIHLIENYKKGVREADKEMIETCLKEIKTNLRKQPLRKTASQVFELKENTTKLLQEVWGDAYTEDLSTDNLQWIDEAKYGAVMNKKNPESINVTFFTKFYPHAITYLDNRREAIKIDKKLQRMGRTAINQTIFKDQYYKKFFTGKHHWTADVRVEGLKPGKPARGGVELTLFTTSTENDPRHVKEYREPVIKLLQDIDNMLKKHVEEVDPKEREEFLKYIEPEQGEGDDDVDKDEPTAKDIADIEKQYNL